MNSYPNSERRNKKKEKKKKINKIKIKDISWIEDKKERNMREKYMSGYERHYWFVGEKKV